MQRGRAREQAVHDQSPVRTIVLQLEFHSLPVDARLLHGDYNSNRTLSNPKINLGILDITATRKYTTST
jgi:hypothetical protein